MGVVESAKVQQDMCIGALCSEVAYSVGELEDSVATIIYHERAQTAQHVRFMWQVKHVGEDNVLVGMCALTTRQSKKETSSSPQYLFSKHQRRSLDLQQYLHATCSSCAYIWLGFWCCGQGGYADRKFGLLMEGGFKSARLMPHT